MAAALHEHDELSQTVGQRLSPDPSQHNLRCCLVCRHGIAYQYIHKPRPCGWRCGSEFCPDNGRHRQQSSMQSVCKHLGTLVAKWSQLHEPTDLRLILQMNTHGMLMDFAAPTSRRCTEICVSTRPQAKRRFVINMKQCNTQMTRRQSSRG